MYLCQQQNKCFGLFEKQHTSTTPPYIFPWRYACTHTYFFLFYNSIVNIYIVFIFNVMYCSVGLYCPIRHPSRTMSRLSPRKSGQDPEKDVPIQAAGSERVEPWLPAEKAGLNKALRELSEGHVTAPGLGAVLDFAYGWDTTWHWGTGRCDVCRWCLQVLFLRCCFLIWNLCYYCFYYSALLFFEVKVAVS